MSGHKNKYRGRLHIGKGKYIELGRFPTKRERDVAMAKARVEFERTRSGEKTTCDAWVDTFLARYERSHKDSSFATMRCHLKPFRADFEGRPLKSPSRHEAMVWADHHGLHQVNAVVTLFNAAVDAELLERNPFRKLGGSPEGRANQAPPTPQELQALLVGCSVQKDYAPMLRALFLFASETGMRPCELYGLEWEDVDLEARRAWVRRRVWSGRTGRPKSNKERLVALSPTACDAIMGLPRGQYIFTGKQGGRLSSSTLADYWRDVRVHTGLDFEFYLATKHYCVHHMWTVLKQEPRVIAEQMGWKLKSVLDLLETYGHGSIGALETLDAAFEGGNPDPSQTHLRVVGE